MKHFPVFLNVDGRRVVVAGAGETAVAKLRLLLKTSAHLVVIGRNPVDQIRQWNGEGRLVLHEREFEPGDALCAAMLYCAHDDEALDRAAMAIGRTEGALTNIVDNLEASQFITPAIVDRDPVTVAIGTEGAAPVLARRIKADLEARLPVNLGVLARIGQAFRKRAELIAQGPARRLFWSRYYDGVGERALADGGEDSVRAALEGLMTDIIERKPDDGRVSFVGAGPGDPELLTMKARRVLHEADVVLHDQLVPAAILELARREATIIETGKKGFGPSWTQDAINDLMVKHARKGAHVVRLKSGDPVIYGRLDEEIAVIRAADIAFDVVPGITAASAAAASVGQSLTSRGRNAALRFVTGHDMAGYADHDWRALAKPDAITAIYMGKKASAHIQSRLLAFGAAKSTPVTVIANASRPDQVTVETTLGALPGAVKRACGDAPAVMLLGISISDATAQTLHKTLERAA